MKLRYSFETVDVGDEIIAVPVGPKAEKVNGIIKLNKSGKEILELLKTETTENEIVDALTSQYEDNRSILTRYVHSLIETFRINGLIEE